MKKIHLLFFLPIFLWSQDLSELINISQKNKLIQSSQETVESVKDEYSSVKRSYLPNVSIGTSYQNTNRESQNMPANGYTSYAKVGLTIYDGNKRYNLFKSYKSYIKSSKENLSALKNEVALDVVNYYYQYLTLEAQKDAKQKEIEQLKSEGNRVKNFVDVGSSTTDEYDKIESRIQSSIFDLNQIELNIITVLHTLEYVTGQEVSITAGSSIKDININSDMKAQRPDIKSLEYNIEKLKYDARQEKSGYLPKITLDNTYSYYDRNYKDNSIPEEYKDQNVFSVNLSWDIFNFNSTGKKYSAKYKEYLSKRSNYEYQKKKADTELKTSLKTYEIGKVKVKAAKASLKAATSVYDSIKSKYQNGLVDNVTFLEALTEKYDALSQLKSSQYDLEINKATIIYYSGKNVGDYVE
ncbi:TolC family protein [Arcobacter sp. KX21116]|uniref:TolC family protein n=1 Tax=Arcobacter iocasae TaxID=2906515 RepID=UPI0035D4B191